MVNKMQLHAVGEMCPGYLYTGKNSLSLSQEEGQKISCETCVHWEDERCNIDLFDKVLTDLDQT